MQRIPITRTKYEPVGGKVVDLVRAAGISFLSIHDGADEEREDVLWIRWKWCGAVLITESGGDGEIRMTILLGGDRGRIEVLAEGHRHSRENIRRFAKRYSSQGVRLCSKFEYKAKLSDVSNLETRPAEAHPLSWPVDVEMASSDVEELPGRPSSLVTPPKKRRQQDLSSGIREPTPTRRERGIAGRMAECRVPSPLAMQIPSAVWNPSIEDKDLLSVETSKLTNFVVDFFTWILQRDLDHTGGRPMVWCAPLDFASTESTLRPNHITPEFKGDGSLLKMWDPRMLLIPVLDGIHYWLYVWIVGHDRWLLYDSIHGQAKPKYFVSLKKRLAKLGFVPPEDVLAVPCPQQQDAQSCGVYLVHNMVQIAWASLQDVIAGNVGGWKPDRPMRQVRKELADMIREERR